MECVINPKVCYTQLPELIRIQRQALDAKIRTICRAHVIRKGLLYFKEDEQQQPIASSSGNARPPLDIASIPGVLEACWTANEAIPTTRSD